MTSNVNFWIPSINNSAIRCIQQFDIATSALTWFRPGHVIESLHTLRRYPIRSTHLLKYATWPSWEQPNCTPHISNDKSPLRSRRKRNVWSFLNTEYVMPTILQWQIKKKKSFNFSVLVPTVLPRIINLPEAYGSIGNVW